MITLTNNYGFEKDKYCFILYYTGSKQKGVFGKVGETTDEIVEFQQQLGYFTSIEGMLRKAAEDAANRKIDDGQIETITDYLTAYNEAVKTLVEAVKEAALPIPDLNS